MKYEQKIEVEIEFEAGDIIEWEDPQEGKILAVVQKTIPSQIDAVVFYDDRHSNDLYKVPHFVIFYPINDLAKLRKVPKSEWKEW